MEREEIDNGITNFFYPQLCVTVRDRVARLRVGEWAKGRVRQSPAHARARPPACARAPAPAHARVSQ